ncbi:hypothetical protein [Sulfobacillus harzensis]|uniref:Uncharacterized protein n=1 Tax=Sulfobacillus harzensis TaxID=2729629 RepID=A0A7Y0L9A1_9FIRM|nr:hypothetical protein [Sulfobacillus harzensis]NMP24870.1 hypothetical protein [Sulfobacillus harzensis]
MSNPEFTLLTHPVHGEHWHRFYSTGQGLVTSRAWGSTLDRGERFVGQAKLVVTWMTGNHAHKGYAIYRVPDGKRR